MRYTMGHKTWISSYYSNLASQHRQDQIDQAIVPSEFVNNERYTFPSRTAASGFFCLLQTHLMLQQLNNSYSFVNI
ncbi:hypothetical protein T07_8855 [Trichinella nelsoni]|uniref:Uncharacterized protein n=1 Tax=Trichinella nelsoni TaxID=6336 RepID=A0A0V0SMZ1_9BILA|nr:hypothetical protein T07_8855 [Trichinella nelsoni]